MALCHFNAIAQCDKKVKLTSSATEYLDKNNTVQRSEEEKSTIMIDKSTITITPGNSGHDMKGTITFDSCVWSIPYKKGKTIIKTKLTDESGDTKNATITIEGKEGKLNLVMEAEEMPDKKIRVPIDIFQETE